MLYRYKESDGEVQKLKYSKRNGDVAGAPSYLKYSSFLPSSQY